MGTSDGRDHQSKGHVVRRRWWLSVHNLSKVTCPLINYKDFNEARAIKLDIKTYTRYDLCFILYCCHVLCRIKAFRVENYQQIYTVTVVDEHSYTSVFTVALFYFYLHLYLLFTYLDIDPERTWLVRVCTRSAHTV